MDKDRVVRTQAPAGKFLEPPCGQAVCSRLRLPRKLQRMLPLNPASRASRRDLEAQCGVAESTPERGIGSLGVYVRLLITQFFLGESEDTKMFPALTS